VCVSTSASMCDTLAVRQPNNTCSLNCERGRENSSIMSDYRDLSQEVSAGSARDALVWCSQSVRLRGWRIAGARELQGVTD